MKHFSRMNAKKDVYKRQTQGFADCPRILQILSSGAIAGILSVLPVLHEYPMHVVALLDQQQGGDRRIYAAGQANDNPGFRHWQGMKVLVVVQGEPVNTGLSLNP